MTKTAVPNLMIIPANGISPGNAPAQIVSRASTVPIVHRVPPVPRARSDREALPVRKVFRGSEALWVRKVPKGLPDLLAPRDLWVKPVPSDRKVLPV